MSLDPNSLDVAPLAKPENLREQIYGELLSRLQGGQIDQDTKLVDTEIAQRFGTSRMPAREALLQLVNEGYLVGTSRGFRLPKLCSQDIRDIFEVRKLLEPHAAGLAAGALDESSLEAMRGALDRAITAAKNNDVLGMIEANTVFRHGWLDALPNRRLAATIARFSDHVQVVRLQTLRQGGTRQFVADGLIDMLAAFEARDAAGVTTRMGEFIALAESSFFAEHESDQAAKE